MSKWIVVACFFACVSLAQAEPIDTNQYGFLREGMSADAVRAKVGEPDSKRVVESGSRGVRTTGGTLLKDYVIEVWTYDGGGNLMDTFLRFENVVCAGRTTVLYYGDSYSLNTTESAAVSCPCFLPSSKMASPGTVTHQGNVAPYGHP